VAGWLAAMCLSPVAGAAAITAYRLLPAAGPVLLAVTAGVLAQARAHQPGPQRCRALLAAAAVTAMAVRVAS